MMFVSNGLFITIYVAQLSNDNNQIQNGQNISYYSIKNKLQFATVIEFFFKKKYIKML